ncbi:uncharacterized protein LOC132717602 [Ruditapes philippinarum]|uniref:uncharacterized protein LOC132717602 n=1 Tax=Ruditapes philippinarum TaxID=129788 RepID=UPI00295B965D|nr:uncharacterized protein LOC132717602 [Ruditapes philippinarum]
MDGQTLIDIKTDSDGVSMFRNPYCLTIDTKGKYTYVSDWYRNEIIKIDLDSYETKAVAYMWHPEGITIDEEGFVYVVETGTNKLFYLHPHCEYSEKVILLHTLPGDWEPFGICFNSAGRKLYVGQAERDTIKVFKVDE